MYRARTRNQCDNAKRTKFGATSSNPRDPQAPARPRVCVHAENRCKSSAFHSLNQSPGAHSQCESANWSADRPDIEAATAQAGFRRSWRRVPESNRSSRICNPLRNLSANPPFLRGETRLARIVGKRKRCLSTKRAPCHYMALGSDIPKVLRNREARQKNLIIIRKSPAEHCRRFPLTRPIDRPAKAGQKSSLPGCAEWLSAPIT